MAIPGSFDWYKNLPNIPPSERNAAEDAGFGFANAFCNIVQSGGGPYVGGSGGGGGLGRAGRALFGWVTNDVCEPYWDDQPTFAPPFSGGQCQKNYLVTVRVGNRAPSCTASNVPIVAPGPIQGTSVIVDDTNPDRRRVRIISGAPSGFTNVGVYTPCDDGGITASIVSVSPDDPEECGNPNPVPVPMPPPPIINNYGDDINYDGDIIGPTNINIGPPTYVDIDGSINIPFTIDGIEFSFDLTGGKGTRPKPVRPSGLGDVDLEAEFDLPEAGEDDDQPFTGPLGIEWEVVGNISSLGAIADSDPIVFPRTVGNLQVKYLGADEVEFYSETVRINCQRGYVPFEEGAVVIGFASNTLPQIGLTGRVVYREE